MKHFLTLSFVAIFLCSIPLFSAAQGGLTLPQVSQKAMVMQQVGLTKISITYSSPAVADREIWGKLVPYNEGKPFPWRAGANENTVISFTHDVKVEGKELEAGSYGLHMIPSEDEWVIIFSNTTTAWGSFFYKEEEDALRVKVKPQPNEFHEWLTYEFENRESASVVATLQWEKLMVPFKIDVDVHAITLDNFRAELKSLPFWGWAGPYQAANYCYQNNINHEEALGWANLAVQRQKSFTTLRLQSQLLNRNGKENEAREVMESAIPIASNAELNTYGYQLLGEKKYEDALKMFKLNAKRNPKDPNVFDSLGEGYYRSGNKEMAIKTLKKSLSMDPPPGVKANSIALLKEMGVEYN